MSALSLMIAPSHLQQDVRSLLGIKASDERHHGDARVDGKAQLLLQLHLACLLTLLEVGDAVLDRQVLVDRWVPLTARKDERQPGRCVETFQASSQLP